MKKVFTCILSILPMIAMFLYTVGLVALGIASEEGLVYGSTEDVFVLLMFVLTIFLLIVVFGVMIYFIIHACRNPQLVTGMKVCWCFLLYQFNVFVFPVYWFIYLRKE